MTVVFFVSGLALLVVGADVLVRGASRLAAALRIAPLVIGLTVIAYGTSAPELAVSLTSAWEGQPDLAVGNVVGSNIANILLILGMSALVVPLVVSRQLIRLDVPLMVLVTGAVWLLGLDGSLGRVEGIGLVATAIVYTVFLVVMSRRETAAAVPDELGDVDPGLERSPRRMLLNLGLVVAGLALLVLGSRWLVDSAVTFARLMGVDELVIGLTVVAVGTSLPEAATSVMAALRGERDMAVGNVVGSNIFNLLFVLGGAAVVSPAGVPVSAAALAFDVPVMTAVAVAALPVFATGHCIARWEGAMFLAYYVSYVTYLVLDATGHHALPTFSLVMGAFVLPLTVVTLLVVVVRSIRHRTQQTAAR
jgi:cation:H+ antiporter